MMTNAQKEPVDHPSNLETSPTPQEEIVILREAKKKLIEKRNHPLGHGRPRRRLKGNRCGSPSARGTTEGDLNPTPIPNRCFSSLRTAVIGMIEIEKK